MTVAVVAVVAVLGLAPTAFGQSTGTGYGGEAGQVAGQVQQGGSGGGNNGVAGTTERGSAASNASSSSGVLPFTGMDLALIVGGGLVLLVGGVALSRLVARNPA